MTRRFLILGAWALYDVANSGEPATPPRIAQARGPPEGYEDAGSASPWADDSAMPGDPLAPPEPAYEFDQRVTW